MATSSSSTARIVPSILCRECGKPAAKARRSTREYCSDDCYSERKRRLRRERPSSNCDRCGVQFERSGNRQKFCSGCKVIRTGEYERAYNSLNAESVRSERRKNMAKLRASDPAAARLKQTVWRAANRDILNERRRTPEYRAKVAARFRNRYKKEPRLVVHNRMASAIYQAIRGGKAGRKWETVVGYTLNDLVRHLERQFLPGMSWKNMGKWHIDHIVPKASFQYETADDEGFRAAWAITNLRPLWAGKNQEKHAKRTHLL